MPSAQNLRRTCAKLCRKSGGDLEQITFLFGHSSVQTTECYLGSEQEIAWLSTTVWDSEAYAQRHVKWTLIVADMHLILDT